MYCKRYLFPSLNLLAQLMGNTTRLHARVKNPIITKKQPNTTEAARRFNALPRPPLASDVVSI